MSNINQSLDHAMQLEGAMAVALVDSESGMMLGQQGGGLDLDLAAAGNTDVVRAKLKTIRSLQLDDTIEDMLITLGRQYHIIRPLAQHEGVFLYLVLDKNHANLALARRKVQEVEGQLEL